MFDDKKLIEAAKLLQEHCRETNCSLCIFEYYGVCMFVDDDYEHADDYIPSSWDIPPISKE